MTGVPASNAKTASNAKPEREVVHGGGQNKRAAKIMLLGPIGVGKTSLVRRLMFDTFSHDYKTTIGVDLMSYDVELQEGGSLRLVIWDTDGDFGESILTSSYVAGASGALVVGDASRPQTLARMALLLEGFERAMPLRPTCAVMNKVDLATPGPAELGLLASRNVIQASAQTGQGVREAFLSLAHSIQSGRCKG